MNYTSTYYKLQADRLRTDSKAAGNSTYPKRRGFVYNDSFAVKRSLVFLINFCGRNPALRVGAKR